MLLLLFLLLLLLLLSYYYYIISIILQLELHVMHAKQKNRLGFVHINKK